MNLREVIKKSIESYFDGLEPEELKTQTTKKMKYNKKYF